MVKDQWHGQGSRIGDINIFEGGPAPLPLSYINVKDTSFSEVSMFYSAKRVRSRILREPRPDL